MGNHNLQTRAWKLDLSQNPHLIKRADFFHIFGVPLTPYVIVQPTSALVYVYKGTWMKLNPDFTEKLLLF
jgi:hypothetical protein